MGIMNIFKNNKKEQEPMSIQEAQVLLSDTRSKMQRLISAMEIVDFNDIRKRVPEEVISTASMMEYERTFKIIIKRLGEESSAELVKLNTDSIDDNMLYFVQHFEQELRAGHKETAESYLNGLKCGVAEGHAPILSSEESKSVDIMMRRNEKLMKYKDIADLNANIDKLCKSRDNFQNKYNEHKENLRLLMEEIDKEMQIKKSIVDRIKKIGIKNVTSIDADAYTMVQKMNKSTETQKQMEDLKKQIAVLDGEINTMRVSIENLIIFLSDIDLKVEDEVFERMEEYRKNHDRITRGIMENTRRFEQYSEKIHNAMEQIFSDPKLIDDMIRKTIEFEETQRRLKQQQEEEAEGMKNYQEYLANQENQENEQRQILNN